MLDDNEFSIIHECRVNIANKATWDSKFFYDLNHSIEGNLQILNNVMKIKKIIIST